METDPYANDPGRWGASLVTLAEILIPCLDAVAPRRVVEVGAYAGDLTGLLVERLSGAEVFAIDPSPQEELVRLDEEHPALTLIRATSLEALPSIPPPEAVVIDGDHNYYTVSEELRLIAGRAEGADMPLLIFHDVCWPHARRDSYFAPELIPEQHRRPMAEGAGLFPGEPGLRDGGLPYHWAAKREGGPRNGVLTAVEDFVAERDGLALALVPAFFGLGVVWRRDAPWAGTLAEVLEKWDRNQMLARLEANRVFHLASVHVQMVRAARLEQKAARQEALLRELLKSRAFSVAELLSRLRQRGRPAFSKEDVRRALLD